MAAVDRHEPRLRAHVAVARARIATPDRALVHRYWAVSRFWGAKAAGQLHKPRRPGFLAGAPRGERGVGADVAARAVPRHAILPQRADDIRAILGAAVAVLFRARLAAAQVSLLPAGCARRQNGLWKGADRGRGAGAPPGPRLCTAARSATPHRPPCSTGRSPPCPARSPRRRRSCSGRRSRRPSAPP